jgi:hypothetical protein
MVRKERRRKAGCGGGRRKRVKGREGREEKGSIWRQEAGSQVWIQGLYLV